jgi:hypothetical protein
LRTIAIMRRILALAILATALALVVACGNGGGNEAVPSATSVSTGAVTPGATTAPGGGGPPPVSGQPTVTADGLQIIEVEAGTGDAAQSGQTVSVHYTGWLADGTQFDSSLDRGQPITFVLGSGQIIPGFDEGVTGMKVGETRRLILPPDLAYGAEGRPPVIPPNAELTFDVQLVSVQ